MDHRPLIHMRAGTPRRPPPSPPARSVLARLTPHRRNGKYEGRTLKPPVSDAPSPHPRRLPPCPRRRRPGHPHRPPRQGRMARSPRRGKWTPSPTRSSSPPPCRIPAFGLKPARIVERLGKHGRRPLRQPHLHPHPRHPAGLLRGGPRRRQSEPAPPPWASARTCAQLGADHHRWRGRPRLRRRRLRRTRSRTATATASSSPSPTSPTTSGPAPPSMPPPHGPAATASTFPDRVVPMLPEALSNGWCSLRPDEDRGCLFVEMHIDAERPQDRPTASAAP